MQRPPPSQQVLLLILSLVESPVDLNAVFRADKTMQDLASDTVLAAQVSEGFVFC